MIIFVKCAFWVPVPLFCGELYVRHVTARGKKMHTLAGFAQLALHVNRHPPALKSADIICPIPRASGLQNGVFLPFHVVLPFLLYSSKANAAKTCCIKTSHVKGPLRAISNISMCPFLRLELHTSFISQLFLFRRFWYYVATSNTWKKHFGRFRYYEAVCNTLTCESHSTPSRPWLWPA